MSKLSKVESFFVDNLLEIQECGVTDVDGKVRPYYPSDGAPAHTRFITQVSEKYNIDKGEFPITSIRPIAWKNAIKEILWIYQDQSNDLDLLAEKYGITWWDEWEIGNSRTIGQRYGATIKKYDLINKLIKGLKEDPYGRRHSINMFQYTDFEETEGLKPCAFETLWTVRDGYLDVTLIQRSSDYLVAGHINKIQYVALQMMIAQVVGLKPGNFVHFVQNLHIYDRHFNQAAEIKSRFVELEKRTKTPKLILNPNVKDFYEFTVEDFEIQDYDPIRPQLHFELGV